MTVIRHGSGYTCVIALKYTPLIFDLFIYISWNRNWMSDFLFVAIVCINESYTVDL